MHERKEIRDLTSDERKRFVRAVLKLKQSGVYDQLVRLHDRAMMQTRPYGEEPPHMALRNAAHRGPVFLPWHREQLRRYEAELKKVDAAVTLPYWDWTIDAEMEDPKKSEIWSEDFMGGGGVEANDWIVETGPFAFGNGRWDIVDDSAGPELRRALGRLTPTLPTRDHVAVAMRQIAYDEAPWGPSPFTGGFRNHLEGWVRGYADPRYPDNGTQLHNRVHVWVGGSMLPGTSPNDPVFYLHHCFIDKIWADWQARQAADGRPDYQPVIDGPPGHRLWDPMFPWESDGATPASVLDVAALGYRYRQPSGGPPSAEVFAAEAAARVPDLLDRDSILPDWRRSAHE